MTHIYEISMIGILTYFLKFQIKQPERGISINKEKDVNDLLRMYDKIDSLVNTPIMPPNLLGPDLNGKAVNESQYRGMIGPLMNLTATRPDIQFSTALCKTSSKYKVLHLISVENFQFESLKLLQRQLFRSLEDWEVSLLQCMQ
ncbi:hypothetical protein Tco_0766856 [Tanacetum coccineum]